MIVLTMFLNATRRDWRATLPMKSSDIELSWIVEHSRIKSVRSSFPETVVEIRSKMHECMQFRDQAIQCMAWSRNCMHSCHTGNIPFPCKKQQELAYSIPKRWRTNYGTNQIECPWIPCVTASPFSEADSIHFNACWSDGLHPPSPRIKAT